MSEDFSKESLFCLDHEKKPLEYSSTVAELFKIIVWYTPNENSYQSQQNCLIDASSVSDEIFDSFCRMLGVDESNILCSDKNQEINGTIQELKPNDCPYNLILKYDSRKHSKTQWLLRHLRNSVSHGRFSIKNNYFIGFDWNKSQYNFFIKVEIMKLHSTLLSVCNEGQVFSFTSESYRGTFAELIIIEAINKLDGFEIITRKERAITENKKECYDLTVRSRILNKTIAFEIKIKNKLRNITSDKETAETYKEKNQKLIIVGLVLYPKRVISKKRTLELNKEKIVLLDAISLKELLKGKDMVTEQLKIVIEQEKKYETKKD